MKPKISASRSWFLLTLACAALSCITLPACKATLVDWQSLLNDNTGVTGEPSPDDEEDASQAEETDQQEHDYGPLTPIMPIPQPFVQIITEDRTLVYARDESAQVPVIGFAEAAPASSETATYRVAGALSAELLAATATTTAAAHVSQTAALTRSASTAARSVSTESLALCERTGVTCTDVAQDGSFELYIPEATDATAAVYLAVVDPHDNASEASELTIATDLHWLKQSPDQLTTLASGTGSSQDIYALSDGNVVKIEGDDTGFYVTGDTDSDYVDFQVAAAELSFNANNAVFGAREEADGVELLERDPVSEITTDLDILFTVDEAEVYSKVKATADGQSYVSVENANVMSASLHNIFDGTEFDPDPFSTDYIKFLENDASQDGSPITHVRTLAFDVQSNGYGIIVFEDEEGRPRLRVSASATRFGGNYGLSGEHDFLDIQVYRENILPTTQGHALLLDRACPCLWLISFDLYYALRDSGLTDTDAEFTTAVALGLDPTAFVLNTDRSRTYVLNHGDQTLSVVALKDDVGAWLTTPTLLGTISLSALFPEKDLSFQVTGLAFHTGENQDYLLLGTDTLKALLRVEEPSLEALLP